MTEKLLDPIDDYTRWRYPYSINSISHSFSGSTEHTQAYRVCLAYCQRFSEMQENGIGIRLHGEVGTGKTFFAECIASYLINAGYEVAWIDCAEYIAQATDYDTRNLEYMGRIANAPVLVIDDIDTKKLNSRELAVLFRLINARQHKVNIITTNMTPETISKNEAADMDEKRALSRIQALCPVALVLTGKDRRKDVAAEKRQLAAEIMNGGADDGGQS